MGQGIFLGEAFLPLQEIQVNMKLHEQGITKRCRLSWRTNSALVYEPKCGGRGGVVGSQLWCTRNKQPKFRFEPKQDLFRLCFGLFRETKKNGLFRFVSVCFGLFRCFEPISKQPKQTKLLCDKPKQP
jgi:hypothetical protein